MPLRPRSGLNVLAAVAVVLAATAGPKSDRAVFATADTLSVPTLSNPMSAAIGAAAIRQELGYDGAGIGVAIIDSGVFAAHPDLIDPATGASRVVRFVDFVNGESNAYDDYGHGTHVAGIVAGNGADSGGTWAGVAPGAHLIVLKVLDAHGRGSVADVVTAIDYAIANKDALNIRVLNLSIEAGVYESYTTDPITLAAKRAVDAGIVVVAAAGNNGRVVDDQPQYGGITAPGNAPWVLTVGAFNDMQTADRGDDTIAPFSSRGPGSIDNVAKPDIVAPGVAVASLADPDSAFYVTHARSLLAGTANSAYFPYISLSGTSIATPVVSGIVALMLDANPSLTSDEVKAILQRTAQPHAGYDALTEGAGFVDAAAAVRLAVSVAGQ